MVCEPWVVYLKRRGYSRAGHNRRSLAERIPVLSGLGRCRAIKAFSDWLLDCVRPLCAGNSEFDTGYCITLDRTRAWAEPAKVGRAKPAQRTASTSRLYKDLAIPSAVCRRLHGGL